MNENARDTQFMNFARLLIPEIDKQIGAVTDWAMKHDIDDKEQIAQELYSRWQTTIAQHAYDFACHVACQLRTNDILMMDSGLRSPGQIISEIEDLDLTVWSEDKRASQ